MTARDDVVAFARTWIGTPYRHQGSAIGFGCDCLGLVRGVWRHFAGGEPEAVPAYSADWAECTGEETMIAGARRHCREIEPADAQAGDILLFRWTPHAPAKHAAILASVSGGLHAARIVHAYDAAGKVAEGHLASEWRRRIAGAYVFPFLEV